MAASGRKGFVAMDREKAICRALQALGVHGHVRIVGSGDRARVYVDGKYFGMYDFQRGTFVD